MCPNRLAAETLATDLKPDGFNISINVGTAAGQTVMHVHVIPRCFGNQPDPRGGMRCICPELANYWRDDR
jgi:diadenosine tetraphosphate (Ap4A) HIT family hydrolase